MPETEKFTFRFYFSTLNKVLEKPRKFFSKLPQETGLKKSLAFLSVSSLFFAVACTVSGMCPNPFVTGSIFFINAIGMVFISAGLGYMAMTMIMGKNVTFARFFSIYAFSSGVTLLASWIPFFIWLTEPWKWWLIGTGLTKACGFSWKQACLVIGVSIVILVLFFRSLIPVIFYVRSFYLDSNSF